MSKDYVPRYFYLVSALYNGFGCVKERWHQSGQTVVRGAVLPICHAVCQILVRLAVFQ